MQARAGWIRLLAVALWCGLIFATSSTVILPHRFFEWIGSHVLTDPETMRRFAVFWGSSWFAIVKGWHAAEYAILFTFGRAMLDRFAGSRPGRNTAIALAFSLVFAISDEYHQTFVPGRGGTWTDVAIDGLGAGLGALVYHRFHQRIRRTVVIKHDPM